MPQMTIFRKEDLSLYYYIKDVVLSNFIELSESIPLNFSDVLSSTNNDSDDTTNSMVYEIDLTSINGIAPYSRGRGFVYFDSVDTDQYCNPYILVSGTRADGVSIVGVPEQSSRVIVYDDQYNVIDPSLYMIDYIDCRIVTSGSCLPAYIDYYWHYIGVVDEWELLPISDPPIVVIDIKPYVKGGYQIGGGAHVRRQVDLHIFASSSAERNDITEVIYDGLYNKKIIIYDFPLGTVLDHDGTWYDRKNNTNKLTSLFDRGVNSVPLTGAWFDEVKATSVGRPDVDTNSVIRLDKFSRYRSKISFYLNYYT